jgi:1-acyl-sn-glycerol-3-phosphate acyltransferase
MNKILIILLSPLAFLKLILVFTFTFILYVFSVSFYLLFVRKKPTPFMWFLMKLWARGILFIMGVKMSVKYEGKVDKPGLILSNHRSYIDIFVNLAINPSRIIAKKEVQKWPFFRMGMKMYDTLILDRGSMASRIDNIRRMEKVLTDGYSLIVYPEGTTYRGPEIGKIKSSTYRIASQNNILTYPIAIEYKNQDDAWVGDDLFVPHFIRRAGMPWRHVTVVVGKPMQTEDNEKLQEYVEGFMREKIVEARKKYDNKKQ